MGLSSRSIAVPWINTQQVNNKMEKYVMLEIYLTSLRWEAPKESIKFYLLCFRGFQLPVCVCMMPDSEAP